MLMGSNASINDLLYFYIPFSIIGTLIGVQRPRSMKLNSYSGDTTVVSSRPIIIYNYIMRN